MILSILEARAFFDSNEDIQKSFWNYLTFKYWPPRIFRPSYGPLSPIAFSLDLLDLEPWIGHTDKKWRKSGADWRSFSLRGKYLDFFRRYKLSSMRLTHHFFNLTKLGWLILSFCTWNVVIWCTKCVNQLSIFGSKK